MQIVFYMKNWETRYFMNYRVKIILQRAFSWVYIENLIGLNKHKFDYPNRLFYELF